MEFGLFSTSTVGNHHHVVYTKDDGTGACSTNAGHTHDVSWIAEQIVTQPAKDGQGQPVLDQQGQPQQEQVQIPGFWLLHNAGKKPHTHNVEKLKLVEEDTDVVSGEGEDDVLDGEKEVVQYVRSRYKTAMSSEAKSMAGAKTAMAYKRGEMWPSDIRNSLDDKSKAHITLNFAKAKLDALCGYQKRNRTDIIYRPDTNGSEMVADIYTSIANDVLHKADYPYNESLVFEDGAHAGRGLLHVDTSRKRRIDGDIVVSKYEFDECLFGPHNRVDAEDCEYIVKWKWISLATAKQLAPEKYTEIREELQSDKTELDGGDGKWERFAGDQYFNANAGDMVVAVEMYDKAKKTIKALELEEKVTEKIPVIYDALASFYLPGSISKYMSPDDLDMVKTISDLSIEYVEDTRVKVTTVIGPCVVKTKYSSLDDFSVVPFYANKDKNYWWGKMLEVKDACDEVNKRHSQLADWGNKLASSDPIIVDKNTFTPNYLEDFKKNSSTFGYIAVVEDKSNIPIRMPNQSNVASGLIQAEQLLNGMMGQLMNINEQLLGQAQASQSGQAIMLSQMAALMGNEYLFDNLSVAKRKVAKLVMRLIRKTWTTQRIIDHLDKIDRKNGGLKIAGRSLNEINKQELETQLESVIEDDYQVVIDESKSSPTRRMANLSILMDYSKGNPGAVPPTLMIQLLDLSPELKNEWMQFLQQQAQAQAQAQQQTASTEIQKTQIAAQPKLMELEMKKASMGVGQPLAAQAQGQEGAQSPNLQGGFR